jgi:DNA-binding FrmR family transcriptional regulator
MKKEKNNKSEKGSVDKILNRISRIEGQVRGLRVMMENKKDCNLIINQVLAVREAVAALGAEILSDNLICKLSEKKKIDEKQLRALIKMK